MRINLPVSNIEHRISENEVLVTRTNLEGIITYCNGAFCKASGYSEAELLGQPHNLIRHPDVPAEIFSSLWLSIQSENPWNGIIKNRCKDGGYYWVEANVTPWIEHGEKIGYVSLRYRATAEQIAAAETLFHALRDGSLRAESRKLDSHFIVNSQQRLAEKIIALEKCFNQTEDEMRIGSAIMDRITAEHSDQDPVVCKKILPASHYSGDLVLVSRMPSGVLHVLISDAVGHGLTAAMNLLPLSQIFYAMTKKGFSVSHIVKELNSKIHRLMPADRFICAALVSIDFREQLLEVWNGGIPAPLLAAKDGRIQHQWPSRNLPLGILGDDLFSADVEIFHYEQDSQLFLFSDGLLEAESPVNEQYGKGRLEAVIQYTAPEHRFDKLIHSLDMHLQGRSAHDDVSLVMVNISIQGRPEELSCTLSAPSTKESSHSHWKLSIRMGEDELKYFDAVPSLTEMVSKIHVTAKHHSVLYVILSELFNNALDHGVLKLDSSIKHGPDGFEQYLHMREKRLKELSSGFIEIEIEQTIIDRKYGVKIRVVDSGSGFDHAAARVDPPAEIEQAQHGRGLALARGMAYKIEHVGRGNEVIAYYICS